MSAPKKMIQLQIETESFLSVNLSAKNRIMQTIKSLTTLSAEKEGFEPPGQLSRPTDFESAPFDHSGISPLQK
jgi:hypothetical protein